MPKSISGTRHKMDVLIIGSGAAGMTLALNLPDTSNIAMLCKQDPNDGSTYYAQGGMAAVLDEYDSTDSHIEDTLKAGAGLCHRDVVKHVVEQSPDIIDWLVTMGASFDRRVSSSGRSEFHLTQEGGHSHRRVIHAKDATGREISHRLGTALSKQSNCKIYTQHIAIDVLTSDTLGGASKHCIGAYALNLETGKVDLFQADCVVLATGGASKVYLYTSNPDTASGDGIAMAWRAGCRVANLEFNQFHPTCLYHPTARSFLISEALRGEGARLRLPDGTLFMHNFHAEAEMAPRDIVARAIDHEMKRVGCDFVLLDISHKPATFIRKHFPNIYNKCLEFGIDINEDPIPIVPAAHYTCGGVITDINGRTDIKGLYAVGETSFTGLHGANRMASNSLLECMVFARSAAADIAAQTTPSINTSSIPSWDESQVTASQEDVILSHNWEELRRLMWDYVGIVRSNRRLQRAKRRIHLLQQEISDYYGHFSVNSDLIELRNLTQVAELIVNSALARHESRGLHFNQDYPHLAPDSEDTILEPLNYQCDQ
ncbi:MAG: L-aspartate oxidase [Gammaproteobacteria bacterium]|nr:L-aspartate oxidase [Gammaproteobacteria bacterium]MBT6243842.1 L-aspartate oxidase [Gammaproteobacteria bacterium]